MENRTVLLYEFQLMASLKYVLDGCSFYSVKIWWPFTNERFRNNL